MVMEIILNAIVEYCLLLSLFVDLTRQAHFFSVYFSRLARLLSSTFVYFTCIRVVFFSRRKKDNKYDFFVHGYCDTSLLKDRIVEPKYHYKIGRVLDILGPN